MVNPVRYRQKIASQAARTSSQLTGVLTRIGGYLLEVLRKSSCHPDHNQQGNDAFQTKVSRSRRLKGCLGKPYF
jgi:hypothetical protein